MQNRRFAASTKLIDSAFITPGAALEQTTECKMQTKTGFHHYLYGNKSASYNLGTLWINGIPKELDIFCVRNPQYYVNNDDVCAANEAIRKLLWEDGEMQTLVKPREIQILFQFATDDSNRNAHFFMQLGLIATRLYFDHRGLEKDKNFQNSRPKAYPP